MNGTHSDSWRRRPFGVPAHVSPTSSIPIRTAPAGIWAASTCLFYSRPFLRYPIHFLSCFYTNQRKSEALGMFPRYRSCSCILGPSLRQPIVGPLSPSTLAPFKSLYPSHVSSPWSREWRVRALLYEDGPETRRRPFFVHYFPSDGLRKAFPVWPRALIHESCSGPQAAEQISFPLGCRRCSAFTGPLGPCLVDPGSPFSPLGI